MSQIDIINPNIELELILCKPNKEEIGILSTAEVVSLSKVIDDIDSITFEVTDIVRNRFNKKNEINELYDEIHEERLIEVNQNEYYVIKSIDEEKSEFSRKTVKAVSLEHKLNRINITLEDVSIVLAEEDVEEGDISVLGLLYSETGWKVGSIEDEVRFDIIDGEKVKKVRWQESISENWYTFLTETISDIFSCVVFFDTNNKIINLFSIDNLGENIGLYLSYDNYMKLLQKQSSTEDIVTRLRLSGKDEIDIREVNPFGRDYIEDYSYFIENNDMSKKLIESLDKHTKLVESNQSRWSVLAEEKKKKSIDLVKRNSEFNVICEDIKVLISMKNAYEQTEDYDNASRIQLEIDEKEKEKNELENKIKVLEYEISNINLEIGVINRQMDRLYAEDENGVKIFDDELLSELHEFLYYDTYANTSYLTPTDLMKGGKEELKRRCSPTVEYSIDSVNFLKKVINTRSEAFSGQLGLGDIVILYDDKNKKEIYLYFVGYEYNPKDEQLEITLSNKKTKINNTKTIADYLKQAKKSKEFVDSKSYIFNQVKYNKIK